MKAFIHVVGVVRPFTAAGEDRQVEAIVNVDHIISVSRLANGKARLELAHGKGPRDLDESYEQIIARIETALGVISTSGVSL